MLRIQYPKFREIVVTQNRVCTEDAEDIEELFLRGDITTFPRWSIGKLQTKSDTIYTGTMMNGEKHLFTGRNWFQVRRTDRSELSLTVIIGKSIIRINQSSYNDKNSSISWWNYRCTVSNAKFFPQSTRLFVILHVTTEQRNLRSTIYQLFW